MFLSPALLGFLALASAPVIIHLLNRRRFIRVDWAPMRVLKQTVKSNRRRVRIEQWILLALRTLAVAALIFAIARPITSGTNLSIFDVQGRASRVVVVDDSLGMGVRADGSTAFERAVNAAGALLERIGPDDEITLITTLLADDPLARQSRIDSPDSIIARLKDTGPSDAGSAWGQTFAAVDTYLKESTYPVREVTLITDLGRHGWGEDVTRVAAKWAGSGDTDGVTLRVLDVGRDAPGGLQLAALEPRDPVVLADVDTAVVATVSNSSAETATGETMNVDVDGVERTVALPDIPAGETVRVPVELTFSQTGPHRVGVRLPPDPLPADGVGVHVLDVRPELDVVLIDGQPGVEPFEGETDFLRLAMTAGYSRVKTRTLLPADWEGEPIVAADLVVLANVDRLPAERVRELEKLVEAGTGLMIFVGSAVSPELYNEQLFAGGNGLLPARLGEPVEVDSSAAGLVLGDVDGSPLAALGKISSQRLSAVRPNIVMPTTVPTDSDARILARWNDGPQSPAVVSGRFGEGGVLLWTVSADRDWSDWPTDPTYVLAVRSAAMSLAGRAGEDRNLTAGESIRVPLRADRKPQGVTVTGPATGGEPAPADMVETDGSLTATFDTTPRTGFYEAAWQEPGGDPRTKVYAISADIADATRDRIDTDELSRLLGPLSPQIITWTGDVDATPGASELWKYLIAALVVMLLLESALATWIDRKRAA